MQFISNTYRIPQRKLNPVARNLALLGNVGIPASSEYQQFIDEQARRYNHVLLIAGEREYEGIATFRETDVEINKIAGRYKNVHFLQNRSIIIDGCKFVGTSLGGYGQTSVMNRFHEKSVQFLDEELDDRDLPIVALTYRPPFIEDKELREKYGLLGQSFYYPDFSKLFRQPLVTWLYGDNSGTLKDFIQFVHRDVTVMCNSFHYKDSEIDPLKVKLEEKVKEVKPGNPEVKRVHDDSDIDLMLLHHNSFILSSRSPYSHSSHSSHSSSHSDSSSHFSSGSFSDLN